MWTYSIGTNIPFLFSGSGEAIPLLHQGRSATSTALTKWTKCFRCKDGFSAVFIFLGLTLHCLLLDTLTSKLKEVKRKLFKCDLIRTSAFEWPWPQNHFYFKETVKDFMSFEEIVDQLFSSYFSVIQFKIHWIMFLFRSTQKVD